MAVAEFLSTVVDSDRLSTMDGRFEWCVAHKRGGNGRFFEVQHADRLTTKMINKPYEYLRDNATHELYIAHQPNILPLCFFCAVVVTPFMAIASLCWSITLFATATIQTVYMAFNEAYPRRYEKGFVVISLDRFETELDTGREELVKPLKKIVKAFWYAIAIEVASINALFHFNNIEEVLKMWMVVDRIEKLWNNEADFRNTIPTVAIRNVKDFERGKTLRRIYQDLRVGEISFACFMLQCLQSRGNTADQVMLQNKFVIRKSFPTYEGLQKYFKSLPGRV